MASKSEVTIHFKNDIPEFDNATTITEALKKFFGSECAINVYDVNHHNGNEVSFELYSEKHNNLVWQQDLLKKYLQEKHSDEVTYFSTNVWTTTDYDIHFEEGDGFDFKDL